MRIAYGALVAAAALAAAVPPGDVEAQDAGGWWAWAAPAVVDGLGMQGSGIVIPGRDEGSWTGPWDLDPDRRERDARTRDRDRRERDARTRDRDRRQRDARARDRDRRDRDDRWDRDSRDDRARTRGGRAGGPAFCRNGEGHPVHGRQWCRDKGFGLGDRDRSIWDRAGWDDVIFGRRDRDGRRTLDRRTLGDVLGDVVLGRLDRRAGSRDLSGRWLRTGTGADVLQVRAGSAPLAELSDLDRDGRVDVVLLRR